MQRTVFKHNKYTCTTICKTTCLTAHKEEINIFEIVEKSPTKKQDFEGNLTMSAMQRTGFKHNKETCTTICKTTCLSATNEERHL
jgi:hypothetical protein